MGVFHVLTIKDTRKVFYLCHLLAHNHSPELFDRVKSSIGLKRNFYGYLLSKLLQKAQPTNIFLHRNNLNKVRLMPCDVVNESLSHVDKVIERLFSGLQQRNLTDCVNVFIVSDHGMADIDCSRSINLGKFVDLSCVRSTEGSVGRLQLTDCPNTTLEQVVKDIGCRNEHMRVYRKELLPVRAHYVHHPRIEPIFLDLDSGWTLLRREPQEGEDRCSGGSHGYDNIFPDMKAFFMALGPSMKKNFTAEPSKKSNWGTNVALHGQRLCSQINDLDFFERAVREYRFEGGHLMFFTALNEKQGNKIPKKVYKSKQSDKFLQEYGTLKLPGDAVQNDVLRLLCAIKFEAAKSSSKTIKS
ncbi:hypothetical protein TNIN_445541 [Trichonephila inaurata madagascariensis]|uniref:Ectonucleotide pyrophosphatase/phosphodiesterase family member 6 n=1 Tax=Trichonephila inaurata madagascariensis TaxID=2747483 RepID=A0A8X7BT94_9ARAC|nr:hypothetical protein TNIN_445541 [Trichonephila inaurata madagascariensis]